MSHAEAAKNSPSQSFTTPHWPYWLHPSPPACSLPTQIGEHSSFCCSSYLLPSLLAAQLASALPLPRKPSPTGPANKATCAEYFYAQMGASLLSLSRDIQRKGAKVLSKKNPSLAGRGQWKGKQLRVWVVGWIRKGRADYGRGLHMERNGAGWRRRESLLPI